MKRFFSTLFLSVALLFSAPLAIAGEDDEYKMTAEEITKIQANIIENGWGITSNKYRNLFIPNGEWDLDTRFIVMDIQEKMEFDQTGFLTKKQFDLMSSWTNPTDYIWGAVSAAPNGNFFVGTNYSSGVKAYKATESKCVSESFTPCKTITGFLGPYYITRSLAVVRCYGNDYGDDVVSVGLAVSAKGKEILTQDARENAQILGWELKRCDDPVFVSPDKGIVEDIESE